MQDIYIINSNPNNLLLLGLKEQFRITGTFKNVTMVQHLSELAHSRKFPKNAVLLIIWDTSPEPTEPIIEQLQHLRSKNEVLYPVIFIDTIGMDTHVLSAVLSLGRSGAVSLNTEFSELLAYIEKLEQYQRKWILSKDLMYLLVDKLLFSKSTGFTSREVTIIREAQKGSSLEETAQKLGLSVHTIVSHRRNILKKAGVKSIYKVQI